MRIFGTMAAALGLVGAIAIGTTAPAAADWYGNHHRYYNYYGGGGGTWNGCRPGWSVQAAFVSPIGVVRGTSMEAARATTDIRLGY